MSQKTCDICGREFDESEMISGHGIRQEIESIIQSDLPSWGDGGLICRDDYNKYRIKYISSVIEEERGSIEELEKAVIRNIEDNELVSRNINLVSTGEYGLGDRISDRVALFGGSWKFIILFFIVLALWIIVNAGYVITKPFDPYPFILMNLVLSCIAAIQAPVIMMSQNRQEAKDRLRSENDYKINLKSEIEIRTLHEKVDHLLLDQWSKMMRIQELQIEMLEEIKQRIDSRK